LELLEQVRQLNPDARTILITGKPTKEAQDRAEKLGVVAILPKPIGTSVFLEAVEHGLRLRGPAGSPVQVFSAAKQLIADRLETLRLDLDAEAVLLIDDLREVIAQVGDLAGLDLDSTLPSLVSAFSAGLKVSSLAGSLLPSNLQYFDGDTHDLYLTNVGAFYALLMVFLSKEDAGQMGAVVSFGRLAAEDLIDILSSLGQADAIKEDVVDSVSKVTAQDPTLDIAGEDVERDDAGKFLDQAVSDPHGEKPVKRDILTYEEARDQGLLAENDGEGSLEESGE
jgi:CheY-like chemotaxis protein